MARDGLGAGAGVALEGADGGVPGPGQQHRGIGAVLGLVREQRVSKLVKGPAVRFLQFLAGRTGAREGASREFERLLGTTVRQPRPLGDRAHVSGRDRAGGPAGCQEHRAGAPAGQEAGQQQLA